MIKYKKQLDPYVENEVRGTRMPSYSRVSKERDIYGELGWIPNFSVTYSKNNKDLHKNFKEYFDQPRQYNELFNNSSVT